MDKRSGSQRGFRAGKEEHKSLKPEVQSLRPKALKLNPKPLCTPAFWYRQGVAGRSSVRVWGSGTRAHRYVRRFVFKRVA